LLKKYEEETTYVLSGGIGPENAKAITGFGFQRLPAFAALDINSRFEIEPGLKDVNLVKKFKNELFYD
jgi:phosphoribosylanthranilate isomerase